MDEDYVAEQSLFVQNMFQDLEQSIFVETDSMDKNDSIIYVLEKISWTKRIMKEIFDEIKLRNKMNDK